METKKSNEKCAIAQNLLSMGLPIALIIQATGLTQEQIDNLKH